MSFEAARKLGVVEHQAEFEALRRVARPRAVTWLATLDEFLDGVEDGLRRGEPERVTLRGLRVPRELAGEQAAVMAAIDLARDLGDIPEPDEAERVALDALPPERRAIKRQAIAQRRAREARR